MALFNAYYANRPLHGGAHHLYYSLCRSNLAYSQLAGERLNCTTHPSQIELHGAAEEPPTVDAAEGEVGVCDRNLFTLSVADGSGVRPGALRPDN